MPLIVISGYPSSGKSTVALRLQDFLTNSKGKTVTIVQEAEVLRGNKNEVLDDSRKEKEVRGKIKSEVQRLINKEDVVIVDALNYIKGYRYELFCLSKGVPTRQITVQCVVSPETAWENNIQRPQEEQYERGVFDRLISRFEQPDSSNRWDSPYFPVLIPKIADLNFDDIFHKLYGISPPKPNLSTVNKPITESSSISSMEKLTSDIVKAVLEAQSETNEEISVPHSDLKVKFTKDQCTPLNLAQVAKWKRQFMNLMKSGNVKGDTGDLFVQYINSQL